MPRAGTNLDTPAQPTMAEPRNYFPFTKIIERPWFVVAACAICTVYVLQAATPLRLDDDAVDYLRMAAALADGRPVPSVPVPIGYPVFLSLIDRAGLGASFFFVLANCFSLAIGLVSAWKILGDKPAAARWCAVFFTLLAIPTIKSVAIALPDAAFFGLSLLALWTTSAGRRANGARAVWLFGAALAITAVATSMRLIGVTLLPALVWSAVYRPSEPGSDKQRPRLSVVWVVLIGITLAALLIAVARSYAFPVYAAWTRTYYSHGSIAVQLAKRAASMAKSWGEIVLNLPFSRFRDWGGFFTAAGVASGFVAILMMRRVGALSPSRVYMLTYLVVLAIWPQPSPRLWMPIIPLIAGEIAFAIARRQRARWSTVLAGAYAGWFVLVGLAALAYSSRITFSGNDFARVYGRNGGLASPGFAERDDKSIHGRRYNEEAQKLLERYGRR